MSTLNYLISLESLLKILDDTIESYQTEATILSQGEMIDSDLYTITMAQRLAIKELKDNILEIFDK